MIKEAIGFVRKYNLCPEMSLEEWLRIIIYMDEKGWIYPIFDNKKIVGMWGGWRIKKFTDKVFDQLPLNEEGRILYIPFACSESKDRFCFLKEARKLRGINEIIFNEHNKNGRLHKIKIRG